MWMIYSDPIKATFQMLCFTATAPLPNLDVWELALSLTFSPSLSAVQLWRLCETHEHERTSLHIEQYL